MQNEKAERRINSFQQFVQEVNETEEKGIPDEVKKDVENFFRNISEFYNPNEIMTLSNGKGEVEIAAEWRPVGTELRWKRIRGVFRVKNTRLYFRCGSRERRFPTRSREKMIEVLRKIV